MCISYRIVFFYLAVAVILILKTALTVGLQETFNQFANANTETIMTSLSKDTFLTGIIGRGILSGIFQVLGWTLFAIWIDRDTLSFDLT